MESHEILYLLKIHITLQENSNNIRNIPNGNAPNIHITFDFIINIILVCLNFSLFKLYFVTQI